MERPLTKLALTVRALGLQSLEYFTFFFQLMSYSTGNGGRKSILLMLLVGGMSVEKKIADVQPACIAAVFVKSCQDFFLKKTAIQLEFLDISVMCSKSSLL